MKRILRDVINELAIDNINHLAIMEGKEPPIKHPEQSVFGLPQYMPIISATVMTVYTIYGLEGDVDMNQEIEWFGK